LNGDSGTITLLNDDIISFNKEFKSFGVILVNLRRKDAGTVGIDENCAFFIDLMVNGLSEYGRVEKVRLKQQEFILLLCMESEIPEQELANFTRNLLNDSRCQAFNYYVCIGCVCDSIQNVHQSFTEADSLLQYFRKAEQTGVYDTYSMTASSNKDHVLNTGNRELVDKVIKYINIHYMEDIGLNIIADYVYLSSSYLGRIFKEISGYSFTDYLVKVRMETAADMLINKNININDISSRVGYCSAQSFSRLFRNYFSCSPSEYRRKNVEKILEKG
jgi:YesN/AraC family two-component response regulator